MAKDNSKSGGTPDSNKTSLTPQEIYATLQDLRDDVSALIAMHYSYHDLLHTTLRYGPLQQPRHWCNGLSAMSESFYAQGLQLLGSFDVLCEKIQKHAENDEKIELTQ